MKLLAITLKFLAISSVVIAVIAFGCDFIPVEGIDLGGHKTVDGKYRFYKIVPSRGSNPIIVGFGFLILGSCFYTISALVKKRFLIQS